MAGSVNMQILVGNLGKDPEIKTFDNGERVANFTRGDVAGVARQI